MNTMATGVSIRGVVRTNRRSIAGSPRAIWVALAVAAHLLLARGMAEVAGVGATHALGTLAAGIAVAAFGRSAAAAAAAGAYLAGSEVLWRMAGVPVFWEFGKFATALVFLVAIARRRPWGPPTAPLLYFLLLLPSAILTVDAVGLGEARRGLSFNLSGPLALAVSVWFFSRMTLSREELRRIIIAFILPVSAIAATIFTAIRAAPSIDFAGASNLITSGGFGPNQVSAILGLGALLCAFSLLDPDAPWGTKALLLMGAAAFGTQSALTLSRGGLYLAAAAFLVGAVRLLAVPALRRRLLVGGALLLLAGRFVLLPQLDAFTSGALTRRFLDLDPTGREHLVAADLQAWRQNPLWGVGPGQGSATRAVLFRNAPAHTEFSRLLAEHGVLGAGAALMLLLMTRQALRRNRHPPGSGLATALLIWSFLYMAVNALRLVAPAFAFGLAAAAILPSSLPSPGNPARKQTRRAP